jgi:hypothetical protein
MTVLGMQLHLVVRNKFLAGVDAICLGTNVVFTSSLVGVVWYVSFVV